MRLFFISLLLLALPASAQVIKQYYHVQYGTGFFVSDDGHLLTNEHVIHGCAEVTIRGPEYPESTATVEATDPQHDLALIRAQSPPKGIARLRENIEDIRPGDPVMLIGYPGDSWKTGLYKISEAQLVSMQGTSQHPEWIQFSDSAQHGNSGGPLIDQSGNVIGVVVAILFQHEDRYKVNSLNGKKTLVDSTDTKTDGAIGLATAEEFLDSHYIRFRTSMSGIIQGDTGIENTVSEYLVNVQCRKQISEEEANSRPHETMQEDAPAEMQETTPQELPPAGE